MTDQSFSTTIIVDKTPQEAFEAIVNPRAWWGESIVGHTDRIGEEWTYRYKDLHHSTQKTTELVPGQKVAWHVTDSALNFLQDKSEWNGTTIVFDISPLGEKTKIRFTHVGLVSAVECFDVCTSAWTGLIQDSLKDFIETGVGDPDSVEKAA